MQRYSSQKFSSRFFAQLFADSLSNPQKDACILAGGVFVSYLSAVALDASEQFQSWASQYEHLQLDELPFALLTFAVLSAWYSRRRFQESSTQFALRKKIESELSQREHLLKKLFDENLAGNCILDRDGNIQMYNPMFSSICGEMHLTQNVQYLFELSWSTLLDNLAEKQEINYPRLKLNRRDKLVCYVTARFLFVSDDTNTKGIRVHIYLADITELCLAEMDLEKTLIENKKLTNQLTQQNPSLLNQSKNKISQTQRLVNQMLIDTEVTFVQKKSTNSDFVKRIHGDLKRVHQSLHELNQTTLPSEITHETLLIAIEDHLIEWKALFPHTYYEYSANLGDDAKLFNNVYAVVYRIILESVNNCHRHANAKWIKIKLLIERRDNNHFLIIEVRDDGCGMDVTRATQGSGLRSMRESTELLKGTFNILSAVNAGSLVFAKFSLTP